MSRPPHPENGIGAAGAPQGAPNVYHPQPGPPPSYDAYADPAIAHGWQNAYDETAELPSMALGAPGLPEAPRLPVGAGPRSRRKPKTAPWRSRRAAVAAGAVGAVSVVAIIAGLSLSGSSDGPEGKGASTGSAAPEVSTEPASGTAGKTEDHGPGSAAPVSSAPPAAPSPTTSDTAEPSAGATTTAPAPTPSATPTATRSDTGSDSGAGSDSKPGKGRGSTKRPR
ncbi:hypothetical protein [Streptomyces sp. NPDC057280]|uniref:hypothetical protein n=1 Tax=Streptomyces sp. NPDC057280 TaxID=3346081 RepID=UPI00363F6F1F